jgi:predicted secreted protein
MKKAVLLSLLLPTLAIAQPTLTLSADARSQVPNDEMVVVLSANRQGPDSAALTDNILSALNAGVKEAKEVPGVQVRMGGVSTYPAYDQNKKIGWNVSGEIVLTSENLRGLSVLTAKLSQSLQLSGVSFRLSQKKREAEEARLLKEAAANFKEKAAAATSAFGYAKYQMNELTVGQNGYAPRPVAMPMMMMARAERASVPTESGDSDVSVNVSGKIDLLKD